MGECSGNLVVGWLVERPEVAGGLNHVESCCKRKSFEMPFHPRLKEKNRMLANTP